MAYLTWNLRHDATNSPPGKRGLHRAPGPQRTHAVANAKVARRDSAKSANPPQLTGYGRSCLFTLCTGRKDLWCGPSHRDWGRYGRVSVRLAALSGSPVTLIRSVRLTKPSGFVN